MFIQGKKPKTARPMMIKYYVLFVIVGLFASCANKIPTSEPEISTWYKGNLHTHSLWSDGDGYPDMIVDWYKSNGYQFLALSDHNILADKEKWITVPKSKMYEEGFKKYLDRFGDDWVEQKIDSGRTSVKLKTYSEYRTKFEDKNFLMIRSEEITDKFEGKPIHLNATNVTELIKPQGGSSVRDVMQRNIDAVLQQRTTSKVPMFPHVNHPNFYYAISLDDMISLKGERFFEVYNGHPLVHNDGDSLHVSTEKMWDAINVAYLKRGQPVIYGLATDDSHNYHQFGASYSNAGRGWIMVRANNLDPVSLVTALENGEFYSSTGVTLDRLTCDKNVLSVSVHRQPRVKYKIEFIEFFKDGSTNITTTANHQVTLRLQENHLFVRAKVVSSKLKVNPFKQGEYEVAWTQPFQFVAK
jgi:hypothetical protein